MTTISSDIQLASSISRLERCLNSRAELMTLQLLADIRLPADCLFRLIRSETGFRVVHHGALAADTDKQTSLAPVMRMQLDELLPRLQGSMQQTPCSCTERLLVLSRKSAHRLMSGGMPTRFTDAVLHTLAALDALLISRHKRLSVLQSQQIAVLSSLLREPERHARRILRLHAYYKQSFYARRVHYLAGEGPSADGDASHFEWEDGDSYARCAQLCHESRVLMTIHMGDFVGAFRYIAKLTSPERPVISLRREIGDLDITRVRRHNDENHQLFMHGQDSPVNIVSALRKGNHSLAVLFDLGRDFGQTAEVDFFSRTAHFVRGPAQLAIAGRARIFPFVSFRVGKRNIIRMYEPFRPEVRSHESLEQAATRVTAGLIRMAEGWIRDHPEQWKYLDVLPAYFLNQRC